MTPGIKQLRPSLVVLIGVVTPPMRTVRRQLIRETTMADPLHGDAFLMRFLHGRNADQPSALSIAAEMAAHKDGVLLDVPERGKRAKQADCAWKTHAFYLWAIDRFPRVPFYAKVEDDSLVFGPRLVDALLPLVDVERVYWGQIMWAMSKCFGSDAVPGAPDAGQALADRQCAARMPPKGMPGTGPHSAAELANNRPMIFASGPIEVRSRALALDVINCTWLGRWALHQLFVPGAPDDCDGIQGRVIRECSPRPFVFVHAGEAVVYMRTITKLRPRHRAAAQRSAVVMHPMKMYHLAADPLWLTLWRDAENGTVDSKRARRYWWRSGMRSWEANATHGDIRVRRTEHAAQLVFGNRPAAGGTRPTVRAAPAARAALGAIATTGGPVPRRRPGVAGPTIGIGAMGAAAQHGGFSDRGNAAS